jgi:AAA family ATP:ADP antiporter
MPAAKLYSLLVVIPIILVYSILVDVLRRHHLLYCFLLFHGIIGVIFSFLLAHPVYGIANTHTSPDRWLGWAFYFFMESFDAFLSTTFWSFTDSINKPKDAKNYYGFIVSGSKLGGICAAGCLYFILQYASPENSLSIIPNALFAGSLLLFAAAAVVHSLIKRVPDDYMHGYEASYRLEKGKSIADASIKSVIKSSVDGLLIMIKNPYVLGIFSLVMFYEIMSVIFDWWVALHADATMPSVGAMTAYYAFFYLIMNSIGLIISLFGTVPLMRYVGMRTALFIFPVLCFVFFAITYFFPTPAVFFMILVGLRSFNYALNHPTREILYIPTTKAIKFKAKTWTDAFGSRIAKSFGSIFNFSLKSFSPTVVLVSSLGLICSLSFFWVIIVYFLGKTLQDAIDNKTVIGQEDEKEEGQ